MGAVRVHCATCSCDPTASRRVVPAPVDGLVTYDVLGLVMANPPSHEACTVVSQKMRDDAVHWAGAVHLRASDNTGVRVPKFPEWLRPFATEGEARQGVRRRKRGRRLRQ